MAFVRFLPTADGPIDRCAGWGSLAGESRVFPEPFQHGSEGIEQAQWPTQSIAALLAYRVGVYPRKRNTPNRLCDTYHSAKDQVHSSIRTLFTPHVVHRSRFQPSVKHGLGGGNRPPGIVTPRVALSPPTSNAVIPLEY